MIGVYVTYWEEKLLFVWVESGKQHVYESERKLKPQLPEKSR